MRALWPTWEKHQRGGSALCDITKWLFLGTHFLCEVARAEASADGLSSLAESLLTRHKRDSLLGNTGRINSARRGGLQNRVFLHVCVNGLFTVKPSHV